MVHEASLISCSYIEVSTRPHLGRPRPHRDPSSIRRPPRRSSPSALSSTWFPGRTTSGGWSLVAITPRFVVPDQTRYPGHTAVEPSARPPLGAVGDRAKCWRRHPTLALTSSG